MSGTTSLRRELATRARTLETIRAFFAERECVEVDTPSLSEAAATDPALASLSTDVASLGGRRYLHTSPEHAMKRLLALGSGDIFQIARVFRDGEVGRWHQPEFLLLEWYRLGYDEKDLMSEVFDLLERLLEPAIPKLARLELTYKEAFEANFGVDPHGLDATAARQLARALAERRIDVPADIDGDALLDLALSTALIDEWPRDTAVFLYDYPASQASLAKLKAGTPPVALRFEVFVNRLELGNGYEELTDASEQRRRFEADNAKRRKAGQPEVPIDTRLLDALEIGLPDCAGVAVGIDRLMALATGAESLSDTTPLAHR